MNLKEQIDADIKKAMLSKDRVALLALRSVKSLILIAETEKGSGGELSKDAELKLLMKAVKQRKESAEIYASQSRKDLEGVELAELKIIEKYLPAQLSDNELTDKLKEIIKKIGASAPSDMGKVMGIATKELAGQADGKVIADLVKKLLVFYH
ncbi:MAG: GatB/YqeY domain-containing protein [Cytophagales bacterium]|nr:GatB/YqeY domain-containing protein [Cytophagales bacterium]